MQHEAWDVVLAEDVKKALGELPPEERRAIELAYFEGYTYIKVAEILNEPEGTVKSRIRNGMRRMRATLVESGIEGADR
jgi:RNA polymerase sigma-70 factor (ECF subfamily)